jgi:DNA invertase Pin-like site-specific DNA recombinase
MAKQSEKITAIYVRVSSNSQDIRSQEPDLKRWIESQGKELGVVQWFIDKHTGKTMDRPKWNKLQSAIENNMVSRLVVWRLDRLGRTASGLTKLFEECHARKVRLVSLKDNLDLETSSGRLMANVLASVASFETELRAERVKAGQEVARASGKTWGGSDKGRLNKITIEQVRQIVKMKEDGEKITKISRTVSVDRPGVYRVLERVRCGDIEL